MTLPPLFKLQSVWKLSSILHLPRRGLHSDTEKRSLSWPWGAHYLVTNENETFALRGTSQAPSRACCSAHSKECTHPLIDWQEAGWELSLALNGLKYACTTFFFFPSFAVRPNDILTPDDLSSPFRAFSSGINWLLPCLMPLMDNHFIFLDYPIYMAIAPNQNEYGKHNARAILASVVL